ncbi:MAG: RcnB family protein [Burkholderiales bacterium]|nr:RcnB family protein [Burkholderiales bacterium]
MKIKKVVSAILAMSLASSGLAFAQDRGDRNDRGRREQVQRSEHQDRRHDERRYNGGRRYERGAGPNHAYYRGDRLPAHYRHRSYVVDNWRSHRLSAPPRGYHWVQVGGDFVLVAIASGIILQLLLNH